MVDTPKEKMAMTKRIQLRISLLRSSQSANVNGAALDHAMEKTAIPAQEKIIPRTMPKTTKTPLSQLPNRMNGRMGESALMNMPLTRTRRTVIFFNPPRMRRASATKTSSCLRSLSIRSALSAG